MHQMYLPPQNGDGNISKDELKIVLEALGQTVTGTIPLSKQPFHCPSLTVSP